MQHANCNQGSRDEDVLLSKKFIALHLKAFCGEYQHILRDVPTYVQDRSRLEPSCRARDTNGMIVAGSRG